MSGLILHAFLISIGLGMGHFLYQIITERNWSTALERSFLQATAIMLYLWVIRGEVFIN